jgi:hypothetical protein
MKRVLCCLLPIVLSAANLPPCNVNSAPCFTIANRQGTAALSVNFAHVAQVYRNGNRMKAADWKVVPDLQGRFMVIVLLPANTGGPEEFQALAVLPPGTS